VHIGLFDEIEVCFLVVSHTHTDIDRYFSYISRCKLNTREAGVFTLDQFYELIEESWTATVETIAKAMKKETASKVIASTSAENQKLYDTSSKPIVSHLSRTIDFKSWISPHMHHYWDGQSKPRLFNFVRTSSKVMFQYRMYMRPDVTDQLCPVRGLNPLVTFPDVNDLRYAPTRPGMPIDKYRKTVDKLLECKRISQDEHDTWYAAFTDAERFACDDCRRIQTAYDTYHFRTKPGAKNRRDQTQLRQLDRLSAELAEHVKGHDGVDWATLPSGMRHEMKFDDDVKEELSDSDMEEKRTVIRAPENRAFHVGPLDELRQRFTMDVVVGSKVLVKCLVETGKATAGLAEVQTTEKDGVILIRWWGNQKDDLYGKLQPIWLATVKEGSKKVVKFVHSASKPTNRTHKKLVDAVPYTQMISPETVIFGPVELTGGGVLPMPQRKMLHRRDDIAYILKTP
jgi:hypothetical protein